MNTKHKINPFQYMSLLVLLLMAGFSNSLMAQDEAEEAVPIVKLHYFNENNSMQYLMLESSMKKGKVFTPQAGKSYELYLDAADADKMIGNVKTDAHGKAKAFLPPELKTAWDAAATHTFIAKADGEEVISDYSITKAQMTIDTLNADGVRSLKVTVMKADKNAWVPAPEVEMKIGIRRLGSILPAGDEQTLTTDESGAVTVELKKLNLPGDTQGNLVLAAKVEDNDNYGNLSTEKASNWGVATKVDYNFFNIRALWTTRFRTPYWLLFMAYGIVLGVWSTLIYLFFQLFKIIKMGKTKSN